MFWIEQVNRLLRREVSVDDVGALSCCTVRNIVGLSMKNQYIKFHNNMKDSKKRLYFGH